MRTEQDLLLMGVTAVGTAAVEGEDRRRQDSRRPDPDPWGTAVHPSVSPAAVVLACAVLALTTAGLGMMVTFRDVAPWNGVALGLMVVAAALAWGSVTSFRRGHGDHPAHWRE